MTRAAAQREAFSESYAEARAKFRDAARAAGAALHAYEHPTATGPGGEALYLDVALLGPADAPRVLAACSGTHGIEGYSGSAAQSAFLASAPRLARGCALAFFHANNPWGFAHRARVTEENVDLNRNFVDHAKPYPANRAYAELHPIVTPRNWDEDALAAAFRDLDAFRARVGEQAFSDAYNGGQYSHPDGLFFGGHRAQWANTAFRAAVRAHLGRARRVAMIDLHTGIGPSLGHVFLCFDSPGSAPYERARAWWGERAVNREGVTHKAVAKYQGLLIDAVRAMLPQSDTMAIVVEFGTRSREDMQRANMAGRWLRYEGPKNPSLAARVHADFIDAFYPRESRWRTAVLEQSRDILERGLEGLAAD
jgi:hypothetical protein